jgi:hypothetical protein
VQIHIVPFSPETAFGAVQFMVCTFVLVHLLGKSRASHFAETLRSGARAVALLFALLQLQLQKGELRGPWTV